jgi:hypothetical protein
VVAYIVDLNDIRVLQVRHYLGLALKPSALVLARVGSSDQHLERDEAIQSLLFGLVNNAHAAVAEQRLNVIAWYLREFSAGLPWSRGLGVLDCPRRGKKDLEFSLDRAHSLPAFFYLLKQLGLIAADVLGRAARIEDCAEQFLKSQFISHDRDWAWPFRTVARQ